MPRFFIDYTPEKTATLCGENAAHAIKSLRMQVGEQLTLCDENSIDYICRIDEISAGSVELSVLSHAPNTAELPCRVTLYQALTKGDKFELIVQKAVELGVYSITPMLTARCISRPDDKSMTKKLERYRKIAEEAAKQSGRGIVPRINELVTFAEAVKAAKKSEAAVLCYEGGGESLSSLISGHTASAAVLIGSEGGFELAEADAACKAGVSLATLGKRILRTETAPLYTLSVIGFITER